MTLPAYQQAALIEALPTKPYCADNYAFGTLIRSKAHAIRHEHLQLNSPYKANFITLDIDYPIAQDLTFIWEINNLPEPTFAVINPVNNHAHLIFRLDNPIYTNNAKQCAFYQDVKQILISIYNADRNFTETLCKNPLHDKWKTIFFGNEYTLSDLKAFAPKSSHTTKCNIIPFSKYHRRKFNQHNADLGHRCELFEKARLIAYNEVRNFNDPTDFFNHMIDVCHDQNPSDLKYSVILSTAKSIARWTWKNRERFTKSFTRNRVSSIDELKERQRKAASSTTETKRAKTLAAIEQAVNILVKGAVALPSISKEAISRLSGKSLSTIKRYAAEIERFIRCAYQVLSPVSAPPLPPTNSQDKLLTLTEAEQSETPQLQTTSEPWPLQAAADHDEAPVGKRGFLRLSIGARKAALGGFATEEDSDSKALLLRGKFVFWDGG